MEHRCGRRSELRLPVRLHLMTGRVVDGHLVNVSLSGAFVRLDSPLPLLSQVVVELDEDELKPARLNLLTGYIVREGFTGVGIEWAEFAPAAVALLIGQYGRPRKVIQQAYR